MSEISPHSRSEQAYHLRRGGLSFAEIAKEMGLRNTAEAVQHYRTYVVQCASSSTSEQRQEVIGLELDRLDVIHQAFWNDAIRGDFKAAEMVLKLMERRSKLLQLDALDPELSSDRNTIVLVSGSQKDFIDALSHGRSLTGRARDDGEDQKEPS